MTMISFTITLHALCERSRFYSLEINMFVVLKRMLLTTLSMRVVFVSLTIHWMSRLFLMNVLNICFNVLTCTQKFLAITFSFLFFNILSKHFDKNVLHALLVSRWRWQFCSTIRLVKSRLLFSFFDCCHWRTQWLVVTRKSSSWVQANCLNSCAYWCNSQSVLLIHLASNAACVASSANVTTSIMLYVSYFLLRSRWLW